MAYTNNLKKETEVLTGSISNCLSSVVLPSNLDSQKGTNGNSTVLGKQASVHLSLEDF